MRPQELLEALVEIVPAFAAEWSAPSVFVCADGAYTLHGVFAAFSHFFRGAQGVLSERQIQRVGELVSSAMREPHSALDNAAATCFLENIAEDPAALRIRPYLDGAALAYVKACSGE